jgi:phosphate/sulfate permease
MTLFVFCIAGTGLSYFLGLRSTRRFRGTVSGWIASLAIGIILALLYYVYSAYGLLFSLDTLLQ